MSTAAKFSPISICISGVPFSYSTSLTDVAVARRILLNYPRVLVFDDSVLTEPPQYFFHTSGR